MLGTSWAGCSDRSCPGLWAGDATPGVSLVPVPAQLAEPAPLATWGVALAPLGLLGTTGGSLWMEQNRKIAMNSH